MNQSTSNKAAILITVLFLHIHPTQSFIIPSSTELCCSSTTRIITPRTTQIRRKQHDLFVLSLVKNPDIVIDVGRERDDLLSFSDDVGDAPATFSFKEQKALEWIKFSIATGAILIMLSYLWFLPSGPHLGNTFLSTTQSLTGTTNPAITIFAMLIVFAVSHSGLAGLRPYAEEIVGPRIWRVIFAFVSLPLALSCISYFVNHCHEGTQLWHIPYELRPALHPFLFITNFISFLFLYPSTFNLLEVAAIETPQLHLWKPEGIIRITRHPQAIGQIMWCAAHTLYLGTDTALATSAMLVLHHVYSIWHGDRRLRQRHGDEDFDVILRQTSTIPFQAVWEGRQVLPNDFLLEFVSGPYLLVVLGTVGAYFAHPYMMAGAALLRW